MKPQDGMVYLVGAGPGDPELITVRGLKLLRQADVVVYDRLIAPELLDEVRHDAETINVGKSRGAHRMPQDRINALLVEQARAGRMVVRLKGGDPFVFGRGYEELTACREAGIPCVVIPGITSALAAPAAAGIPVTCRELVRSVAIVTPATASEGHVPPLDFGALAKIDTLVILMGRATLPELADALMAAGRAPSTPAACIEWATTPRQRVVTADLATLADAADAAGLGAPVVTVVGQVAAEAHAAVAAAQLAGSTR